MDVPPTLAQQLQALSDSPDPFAVAASGEDAARPAGGALIAQVDRLSREVIAAIPSCVAVSIAVTRLGIDVVLTLPLAEADPMPRATEALSSLALSLPAAGVGCVLVLQASAPGAFVLLADDLALLGSGRQPPELDAHRAPLTASTGPSLAGSLAELSLLDRALGVLIGQGWSPEAAEAELHRRSTVAGLRVAAVAERLLASPSPAAPDGSIDSVTSGSALLGGLVPASPERERRPRRASGSTIAHRRAPR